MTSPPDRAPQRPDPARVDPSHRHPTLAAIHPEPPPPLSDHAVDQVPSATQRQKPIGEYEHLGSTLSVEALPKRPCNG